MNWGSLGLCLLLLGILSEVNVFGNEILEDYYQEETNPELLNYNIDFYTEDNTGMVEEYEPQADYFAGFETEDQVRHAYIEDESIEPVLDTAEEPLEYQMNTQEISEPIPYDTKLSIESEKVSGHEDIIYRFLADMKKRKQTRQKSMKKTVSRKNEDEKSISKSKSPSTRLPIKKSKTQERKKQNTQIKSHQKKNTKGPSVTKSLPTPAKKKQKKKKSNTKQMIDSPKKIQNKVKTTKKKKESNQVKSKKSQAPKTKAEKKVQTKTKSSRPRKTPKKTHSRKKERETIFQQDNSRKHHHSESHHHEHDHVEGHKHKNSHSHAHERRHTHKDELK